MGFIETALAVATGLLIYDLTMTLITHALGLDEEDDE